MRMRVVRSGDAIALEHVLREPRPFIPEAERDLEARRDGLALLGIEALVVDARRGASTTPSAPLLVRNTPSSTNP